MKKYTALNLVRRYGDALVTVNSTTYLVTTDFSCKYIKRQRRRFIVIPKDKILVFNWSLNKMTLLDPLEMTKVEPLSSVLRNRKCNT